MTAPPATLHQAVLRGDLAGVKNFLAAGANIHATDDDGNTALHIAAWGTNQQDIVTTLLEHGADVNAVNNDGDTPLMMAVSLMDNAAVVRILLQSGASVTEHNSSGETALSRATQNGYTGSAKLIAACRQRQVDFLEKKQQILRRGMRPRPFRPPT